MYLSVSREDVLTQEIFLSMEDQELIFWMGYELFRSKEGVNWFMWQRAGVESWPQAPVERNSFRTYTDSTTVLVYVLPSSYQLLHLVGAVPLVCLGSHILIALIERNDFFSLESQGRTLICLAWIACPYLGQLLWPENLASVFIFYCPYEWP